MEEKNKKTKKKRGWEGEGGREREGEGGEGAREGEGERGERDIQAIYCSKFKED
jgi:hypothetical protein